MRHLERAVMTMDDLRQWVANRPGVPGDRTLWVSADDSVTAKPLREITEEADMQINDHGDREQCIIFSAETTEGFPAPGRV